MTERDDLERRAEELIAAGAELHRMGLVPATSGNLSARLVGGFAITASGAHKGRLTRGDILHLDAGGAVVGEGRPSAETALHLQVYRRVPHAGAVLHPHAASAVVLSRLRPEGIVLRGYELAKALEGITDPERPLHVPVFPNDQDVPRLAALVDGWMDDHGPPVGYVIAGHGLYTWGATVAAALVHVEALDYLLACELRLAGGSP